MLVRMSLVVCFYLDVHLPMTTKKKNAVGRYWVGIGRATAAANDDEKENFKIDGSICVRGCAFQ